MPKSRKANSQKHIPLQAKGTLLKLALELSHFLPQNCFLFHPKTVPAYLFIINLSGDTSERDFGTALRINFVTT